MDNNTNNEVTLMNDLTYLDEEMMREILELANEDEEVSLSSASETFDESSFEPLTLQNDGTSSAGDRGEGSSSAQPEPAKEPESLTNKNKKAPKKTRRPRRKKKGPKKPLSCYNIFFQYERARILNNQDHLPRSINAAVVKAVADDYKARPVRKHRKSHGKITFSKLAKTIGVRWKTLSAEEKGFFNRQGTAEWLEYERLAEWFQKQQQDEQDKKKERQQEARPQEESDEESPPQPVISTDEASDEPKKTNRTRKKPGPKAADRKPPASKKRKGNAAMTGPSSSQAKKQKSAPTTQAPSPVGPAAMMTIPVVNERLAPPARALMMTSSPSPVFGGTAPGTVLLPQLQKQPYKSGGFAPSSLPQAPMNPFELRKAFVNSQGGIGSGGPNVPFMTSSSSATTTRTNNGGLVLQTRALPAPPALGQPNLGQPNQTPAVKETLLEEVPWSTEVRLSPIFRIHAHEDLVASLHKSDISTFFGSSG